MEREERDMLSRAEQASELVGSKINQNLDEQDEVNVKWAREQIGDKLRLFDDAIGLYMEVINSTNMIVHEADAQIAHRTLAVRAFNDLRAAYKLLIAGYYAQTIPLFRSVMECNSRMRLFLMHPDEATSWLDGKQMKDSKVRQRFDDSDIWGETYGHLSDLTHANLKVMAAHAYDTVIEDVKALFLGGYQNLRWMRLLAGTLVGSAVLALAIASKPYDSLLGQEWHNRFNKLHVSLLELAQSSNGAYDIDNGEL